MGRLHGDLGALNGPVPAGAGGVTSTKMLLVPRCGSAVTSSLSLLLSKLAGAPTALRRICDGLYPRYSYKSTLTRSIRRGVDYLCFAATPKIPRWQSGSLSSPRLLRMRERVRWLRGVQAKEAAAKAAASSGFSGM